MGKLTRLARPALLALVLIAAVGLPVLAQQTPGLDNARTQAGELAVEFHRVEVELDEATDRLEENRAITSELRSEVAILRKAVITTAVSGFTRSLDVPEVLKSGSPVDAVRADALGDAAIGADDDSIDSYSTALADLAILEAGLAADEAETKLLHAEIKAVYDEIIVELERLETAEEERILLVAKRAEEAKRNGGVFIELVACPIGGVHTFIDSWGFARSGGRRHKGVDMMAKAGTPIVAPLDGTVAHRSNRVGGRSFHLLAADGTYFYGTHMSAYGKSGDVKAGDIIGYVGDDGNAAGLPHLHLEIHPKKGSPTNPYPSVAVVCEGAS